MDSLDRMYRRLVQNIRAGYPDLLTRSFEVSLIYQQIIPYRLNRRELGLDSNDEYELTLLQLLSGARGLLAGDEEMQRALREELESSNPDLSAFRAFATSSVTLVPEALRALDAQPRVRPISPAPAQQAPNDRPLPAGHAELAGRATEELAVPAAAAQARAAAAERRPQAPPTAPVAAAAPPKPRPAPAAAAAAAAPKPKPAPAPAAAPAPTAPPVPKPAPAPAAAAPAAAARPKAPGCRYCGGELPDGRDVHFCPHCGQNLTIKQCPACSTELELGWQFCVNCGRQVE